MCLDDLSDLDLKGTVNGEAGINVEIIVSRCSNSTNQESEVVCKTDDEINAKIHEVTLVVVMNV